jgi:hypothetical protein
VSTRHCASSADVFCATWPVQLVVRSSVASWMITGTRSELSFASSSTTSAPIEFERSKAGWASSGWTAVPASIGPPRWE